MGNASCGLGSEGTPKTDIEAPKPNNNNEWEHSESEKDDIPTSWNTPRAAVSQKKIDDDHDSHNLGFLEGCCSPVCLPENNPRFDGCCEPKRLGKTESEEPLDVDCLKEKKDCLKDAQTIQAYQVGAHDCNGHCDGHHIEEKLHEHKLDKPEGPRWDIYRGVTMVVAICITIVVSSFFQSLLDGSAFPGTPSLESTLRYGSIPIIAAIIGYGTNVLALEMMFYPLEFVGCFPQLKIGLGLDLFLCGWQGVIPMKAREMAEISVDMMTKKLIKVEDVFSRLKPEECANIVSPKMPGVVSTVIHAAGREHCPTLWELLPIAVRSQLEESVKADARHMMSEFILQLQANIADVFDLKSCVVDCMISNKMVMVEMFQTCGAAEFEFIRVSGFYLGFSFGLFQMAMWVFVKLWWILPLCGLFVGYFTNVIALKVIFLPVEKQNYCGIEVQGLFLQRQKEVSALYAKQVANTVLSADVLMTALVNGPKAEMVYRLLDDHVSNNVEAQAAKYKHAFIMVMGTSSWISFREGMCTEFRKQVPMLLHCLEDYAQEAMDLETTLRTRMEKLPSREFERLLHAVFEQDEIKLILVGALLGAIVGFLQAVVQTPEQLGIKL